MLLHDVAQDLNLVTRLVQASYAYTCTKWIPGKRAYRRTCPGQIRRHQGGHTSPLNGRIRATVPIF